jgi:DUF438 domain-containing protein
MTTLSDLKAQQSEIREMSRAVHNLMTPEQQAVGTIARITHTLLCDLCEKVTYHLAEEHQGVFPSLLSRGDQKVKNMVWGFINNDKPLREAFNQYKRRWLKDCKYDVDPRFIEETRQILSLLEERLQLEDTSMIPRLEEVGAFAHV